MSRLKHYTHLTFYDTLSVTVCRLTLTFKLREIFNWNLIKKNRVDVRNSFQIRLEKICGLVIERTPFDRATDTLNASWTTRFILLLVGRPSNPPWPLESPRIIGQTVTTSNDDEVVRFHMTGARLDDASSDLLCTGKIRKNVAIGQHVLQRDDECGKISRCTFEGTSIVNRDLSIIG